MLTAHTPRADAHRRDHHHRRLSLASEPSGGYRVPRPSSEPRQGMSFEQERLRGVPVLIVDDEPDVRELLLFILTESGADVRVAGSADEALRLIRERPPAIIVSDLSMPGRDGYWLIEQVRKDRRAEIASIPALAITAFGREYNVNRALSAGFQDYLQKPLDPEAFCIAVARLAAS
jgi:hypothetical protein